MKSLLSSFSDDFNATIEVLRHNEVKSETWFVKNEFTSLYSWVKCLLLRNKQTPYNNFIDNSVEYIQTTHKARLEKNYKIKEKDKVIDQNGREFEVKFVEKTPWFWWSDDHLLLFLERIKNE